MPLPLSTTILLFAAFAAMVVFRKVSVTWSSQVEVTWSILALVAAAIAAVVEMKTNSAAHGDVNETFAWCCDQLAVAEQFIVLIYGFFTAITLFESYHLEQRQRRTDCGYFLFLISGIWMIAQANDLLIVGLSLEIISLAQCGLQQSKSSSYDVEFGNKPVEPQIDPFGRLALVLVWLGIAWLAVTTSTTNYDTLQSVLVSSYQSTTERYYVGAPSKLVLLAVGSVMLGLFSRSGLLPLGNYAGLVSRESSRSGFLLQQLPNQLVCSIALVRLLGHVFHGMGDSLATLILALVLINSTFVLIRSISCLSANARSMSQWLSTLWLLQSVWIAIGMMILTVELTHAELRAGVFANHYESLSIVLLMQLVTTVTGISIDALTSHYIHYERKSEFIEDFKGLWYVAPCGSILFVIAFGSLVGLPLTAGFWSRWMTLLAGQNLHLKHDSSIFSPNMGLRMALLGGMIATLPNISVLARLIRELFLESPLARPYRPIGNISLVTGGVATGIILILGTVPSLALKPVSEIRPPIFLRPEAPKSGSGTMPVGMNSSHLLDHTNQAAAMQPRESQD